MEMDDWKKWSDGWLKEGHYLSYNREGVTYYERIIARDFAHYEWAWPETVSAGADSGPHVPDYLEVTKGYDPKANTNQIWQMIFGIKGQVYIYIELPTDLKRHGLPKLAWPTTTMRTIAHFEEWMSQFREPSFITEHFMMRPITERAEFTAYNPNAIDMPDVCLNILLAKILTERIGTEQYTEVGVQLTPSKTRFNEILTKLYQRLIACRPITLEPVRAPAEAPAGE
jgi:hypothetical protein